MIHGLMIARSAAAMPPPPPVQREAICRPVIAVRPILPVRDIAALAALVVTLVALAVLRLLLRLTAGNERRQPINAAFVFRSRMLGTRLKLLRVRRLLRLIVLLLIVVGLLARIILLRLARGEWLATDMRLLVVSLVITLIGAAEFARLLRLLLVVRRLTSAEAAPGPRRSAENNARRAGNSFPLQLDRPSFARRAPVGDIFPQRGMPFREFLCPVHWTRTFGIMDFDVDDDDAHLCGYDRAYVCSDRFSWFAVPPTPFTCNGTFAAASFPFTGSPSHRLSAALNFPSQYSVSMFSLEFSLSPSPLRQTKLFPGSFSRGVQNSSRRAAIAYAPNP